MEKLKAYIVDDEENARLNLQYLLEEYCPDIEVVATASNGAEAIALCKKEVPDVLFLDIKMPDMDGFEVLEKLSNKDFALVFTTAHNEFALQAIKEQALDYLEKPVSIDDLEACAERLKEQVRQKVEGGPLEDVIFNAANYKDLEKMTIPTRDGFAVVNSADIVHLEASDSYTKIFMNDERKFLSSKNIRVFEQSLDEKIFFRTHKSHIVNLIYHLRGFARTDGNVALMSNGSRVPISRRKLSEFMNRVGG